MPASKTDQYSALNKQLALLARALAHPARIRIIELLRIHGTCRNKDFVGLLTISENSVHNHLSKLKEAGIIRVQFRQSSFQIELDEHHFLKLEHFLTEA